jgi:hypothetical protein
MGVQLRSVVPTCFIYLMLVLGAIDACEAAIATYRELSTEPGEVNKVVVVLGHSQPGDGGGGTFFWDNQRPHEGINGGTVAAAASGGVWRRLFTGGLHAEWFGVFGTETPGEEPADISVERTARLQNALNAARGNVLYIGPGTHYLTETLSIPQNTRVEGVAPMDVWSDAEGGTTLETAGEGTEQVWQDTGDPTLDRFRPLLIFGGNNVHLRNIGVKTGVGSAAWDVGVMLPAVKRCSLQYVAIDGHWTVAGCLLDATWSAINQKMIDLHGGRINPSHMNECDIYSCVISGNTGLMIRGAVARNPNDYDAKDWLWSFGGTSDINIISCRLEGKGDKEKSKTEGAAYYSNAPMANAARGGQGHRLIACNLRARTRYMVYLGSSNRDRFTDCYFESRRDNSDKIIMYRKPQMPGMTTFVACRFVGLDFTTAWDTKGVKMWGSGGGATF